MASSSISVIFPGFFVLLIWLRSTSVYANGCYTSIISFGDSISDTGNLKHMTPLSEQHEFFFFAPPYGENFINQATGRCSNGRLIIDFFAERLGLPFIPPFLQDNQNIEPMIFKHGVNYAVAGATALHPAVLEPIGFVNPITNASLGVQLSWFKQSLPSICGNDSNCKDFLARSLILVGEIGGDDYNFPFLSGGKSIEEVIILVPLVIDTIISTVVDLINMGAKSLVVPGNFPIGCSAAFLTLWGSKNEEYDPVTGCLVRFNQFAEYHNKILQTKLNQVQYLHPDVNIIYADYYNAAMEIYLFPNKFGFTNGALKACCGGGGRYNVNATTVCGDASATLCDEPNTYVSWDGLHLTEAAYRIISRNLFSMPQFSSLCFMLK